MPEKQAGSVASGRSWTCASAHLVDKARHVPMFYTLPGKPNTAFEASKYWKSDPAPHLKAAEAEKDKARLEELKKLRWDASISGSQSLLKGANKDKTKIGKSFGNLEFLGPIDCGAGKEKKVIFKHKRQWGSLSRDVFEFLGLLERSGPDVQLACSVAYSL